MSADIGSTKRHGTVPSADRAVALTVALALTVRIVRYHFQSVAPGGRVQLFPQILYRIRLTGLAARPGDTLVPVSAKPTL